VLSDNNYNTSNSNNIKYNNLLDQYVLTSYPTSVVNFIKLTRYSGRYNRKCKWAFFSEHSA